MDIAEYAQSLMDDVATTRDLELWAREAQRLVAWHAIRLVPYVLSLSEKARAQYLDVLADALSHIDSRVPLVVPAAAQAGLLDLDDERLTQLVSSRTVLDSHAA